MKRVLSALAAVLLAAACSTTETTRENGSSERLARSIFRGTTGEIQECGTRNAPPARLQYPVGWFDRVSAAETEGELLGGAPERVESNETLKPRSLPSISYPADALSPPVEARCEAKFDLSTLGEASNILVACSDRRFVAEMTRIISVTTFEPLRVNGQIARGVNVVYPFSFCLSDEF